MRSNISTSGQSGSQAKRTFTEEARRAQILTHAIDVVVEHGYAGASLNRIAAHAGISKGLISYHFDGKADLLEALVRDVFDRGAEIAMRERPDELSEDAPSDQALRAYLEANLTFIAAHSRDVSAVVEVVGNHRDADGALVFDAARESATLTPLMQLFREGQSAGAFREFDPRVMAIAVRRVVDGFSREFLAHPEMDVAAFTAEVVALFDHATRRGAGT